MRECDATDLPEDVTGFLEFYEARRTRMRHRLMSLLGVTTGSEQGAGTPDASQTVPDDGPDPGNEGL